VLPLGFGWQRESDHPAGAPNHPGASWRSSGRWSSFGCARCNCGKIAAVQCWWTTCSLGPIWMRRTRFPIRFAGFNR